MMTSQGINHPTPLHVMTNNVIAKKYKHIHLKLQLQVKNICQLIIITMTKSRLVLGIVNILLQLPIYYLPNLLHTWFGASTLTCLGGLQPTFDMYLNK
jgi:hypothetical protein